MVKPWSLRAGLVLALWFVLEVRCQLAPNPSYWAQAEWAEEQDSSEDGQFRGPRTTSCRCGWTNKATGRIVGGRETFMNEYPHMAALARTDKEGAKIGVFCGAAIVTAFHALTAAHCTIGRKPADIIVIVGEHNLSDDDETAYTRVHAVKDIIQHSGYDAMTYVHDISILVVNRRIEFNEYVGPACLPTKSVDLLDKFVKVTGWGNTKYRGQTSSVLLKVNLRVIPLPDCSKKYWNTPVSTTDPTQFCTYGLGKDACQGDSGGPLVWLDPETNRFTLVGLVSYGWACAKTTPGVNTDVHAYLDWIQEGIRSKYCI
ncbi:hypothetical protein AAG570_009813 [Ranatra chinensis]|uniref:Peptidase S1 domain-containing protein n=1 Tax=Ranatra chinensis TaxID=642074 RepID=A0ABD0YQ74_9HEMI